MREQMNYTQMGWRPILNTIELLSRDLLINHKAGSLPGIDYWDSLSHEELDRLVIKLSRPKTPERSAINQIMESNNVASVLDCGCGPCGQKASMMMTETLAGVEYMGVDVSKQMLAKSRQLFPDVQLHQAEANRLPFAEKSFDAVLMKHLLEHQPDGYKELVREALRVAKKCVIIDFFHLPLPFYLPTVFINHRDGYANHWYGKKEFEEYLRTLGLETWDWRYCLGKSGQIAAIYTLHK